MRLDRGEVHLWRTSTRVPPIVARDLHPLLSNEERARTVRFKRDADRDRYLAAHAMSRLVLSRYLGVPPGELEFDVGEQGKPRLKRALDCPLSFNLSHSGDQVLLAVSGEPAVGVDIEEIRDDVDVAALARSVLSAAERRLLYAEPAERQRSLFFRSWVRKEAVLKGCGLGFSMEPQRVVVLHDAKEGDTGFAAVKLGANLAEWGVRDVEVGDRYAGAVAAGGRHWALRRFEHRWPTISRPPDPPGRAKRS
jgi:4'-phosphopantetheinyl transferase